MGNVISSCEPGLRQALIQVLGWLSGDGNYIHTMETNLKDLEKTMQLLKERRDDLSRKVFIEEAKGLQQLAQVQGWFERVQHVESEVNQLLEDKSTETQRLYLFGYCSNNCISSWNYGKEVSEKLKEVLELLFKGVFVELAGKAPIPKVVKQHIKPTVGLDSMVNKAWASLMDPKGTTLGIYGMGGVGKTTLLARINNKFLEEVNKFDVVIWVIVSKDLQIESIQDQILRRLRPDEEWKQKTEVEKTNSIYINLERKKFVLLLDDIWSDVDLNKIGVPPPAPDNGSKIVFTTRSKDVCRAMKPDYELNVECLSPDEAWELFQNNVGEKPLKCHEDIPALAREVAEQCCGLPLALTVIGKAMTSKENVHEWRHALNVLNSSSHEFPGMGEKILSLLKFSYDGVGNENIKSCFLYCSLFPEDYEIPKEELIECWIGEGFINGKREEDGSNSQGHAIIGFLVRASLLTETGITMERGGRYTENVKMHDVIREMALWITSDCVKSGGQLHFVKSGAQLTNIPNDIKWEVKRRISLMSNQIEKISGCPNCPILSTLLLQDNSLKDISGEFFQFMSALVVLNLSRNSMLERFPEEISSLSSLKYLNLSNTRIKSLPVGLKALNKLISLNLEFTHSLRSINGIGTSLPNLQVLKLWGSDVCIDARLLEELQLLEHLEILTGNIEDALILERIQGVKRLANSIRVLSLPDMSAEVVVLNTAALSGLHCLYFHNCKISEIKIDLEIRKEKEELQRKSFLGFKHLSTVFIYLVEGPNDLTWLLFAQNLKFLHVWNSTTIEEIINGEEETRIRKMHPSIHVPFLKLHSLHLLELSELKRICFSPTLPNLKNFSVEYCPNLPEAATKFQRQEEEEEE